MGTLLAVTCNSCRSASEQIDGAVMLGFNRRCDQCGKTAFVSLEVLYAGDPPDVEPASAEAWRLRRQRIGQRTGDCSCGGSFRDDEPVRCLSCRSTDVVTVVTGIAD